MGNTESVSYSDKALMTAAEKGNLPQVTSLIEGTAGANVNFTDEYGWSPLLHAICEAHPSVANYLMSKGANVFQKTSEGSTALHLAVTAESEEIVKALIARRVDVNAQNQTGWTPLHLASLVGNRPIIRILLENNADPSLPNAEGNTPPQVATSGAQVFQEFADNKDNSSNSNKNNNNINNKNNNNINDNNAQQKINIYEEEYVVPDTTTSTGEQLQQLRGLQNRVRAQPVEMKGYSALIDDPTSPLVIQVDNNSRAEVRTNVEFKEVLDAIKILTELNPQQLHLAQMEELINFHHQQLQKYYDAKEKLEHQRTLEMDRLLAD